MDAWFRDDEIIWADVLKDFSTDKNCLSVWKVADNLSDLEIVLTALVSNRKKIDIFDYALLDDESFQRLQVKSLPVAGETPCNQANGMHLDLVELSGSKVVKLARAIFDSNRIYRLSVKQVTQKLKLALGNQMVDRTLMDPGLVKEIEASV